MRIRKHARLLAALSASSSVVHASPTTTTTPPPPHNVVCELNMSPWDVISPDELPIQVGVEDDIMGNSSTVGESVASLLQHLEAMRAKEEVRENQDDDDEEVDGGGEDYVEVEDCRAKKKKQKKKRIGLIDREVDELVIKRDYVFCNKADGKGWRCPKEAKQGHSLCDHHLAQLRSYHANNNTSHGNTSTKNPKSNTTRKANAARNCRAKAKSSASSSSEFYYYSGFGPLWGKKRTNELSNSTSDNYSSKTVTNTHGDDDLNQVLSSSTDNTNSPSDFIVDIDDLDYEDDYDDDDDGKKRFRKPIKARSLKSLL
ncbi:hypothetical protein Sjap_020937 [Stephania japonica]|uniref:WRC domain-containing protein n=1 Tax=Stephania japonica TaxID=461633 RepID=A0AAP0F6W9_9MAGN